MEGRWRAGRGKDMQGAVVCHLVIPHMAGLQATQEVEGRWRGGGGNDIWGAMVRHLVATYAA